jgi:hypothetical protein
MEDISYLAKHAKEESFLFIVDSSKRNKNAYPNPNEYSIEFDRPFTNVFGFDLLYASIPRTEYTVDAHSNQLTYRANGYSHTLTIEPGDYNLVQLCNALNSQLQGVQAEPHSSPYQLTSRIRLTSMHPFAIDAATSTLTPVLGFFGTGATYESVLTGQVEQRTFQGPYAGLDYFEAEGQAIIRQPFVPSITGSCSKLVVQLTSESVDVQCRIIDANDLVYGSATISASENAEVAINDGLMLTAGFTYYAEFTSQNSFGIYRNLPLDGSEPAEIRVDDEWQPLPSGDSLAVDLFVTYAQHQVEGPGLVDLTGERHVIVRCDEIESHFHRGRKTETFHSGVGMVRMGANGYQDQRFDFVSFPSRRLVDPIGKLKTLSFRLTKPDGSLYNTRGVDHTLLCVIKYYMLVPENTTPSIINPHYTPDLNSYLAQKWIAEMEQKDALRFAARQNDSANSSNAQQTAAYRIQRLQSP